MRRITLLTLIFVVSYPYAAVAQANQSSADQIKAVLAEIKSKASLKLSGTTDKSAIEAASRELSRLSKISVAASIDEDGASLTIAQQIKTEGKFGNPKFKFENQAADGTIQFIGPLTLPIVGVVHTVADLHVRMATSIQIDALQNSTDFRVGFSVTALEFLNLRISRDSKPVSGPLSGFAEAAINGILIPAQQLLNHIELRLPTTLVAKVELKASQKPGLSTSFEPEHIGPKLNIVGFSHIIDNGRITAVFQEGGSAVNTTSQTSDIATFRTEFLNKLAASGVTWINQGQLSAYVDRELIKSLITRVMSAGSICMSAKANDLPMPFDTRVKLPASEMIDCSPTRDCTPNRECRQNIECAQKAGCRRCRKAFGGKVCWNDPGCELGKVQRKATCETGKESARLRCESEKSAQKVACEAIKEGERATCETFKGTYDAIRRTGADYASVSSKNLLINGDAKICLEELAFDQNTLVLSGKLQVVANARASGEIKFTPLNIVGHASCFVPIEKSLTLAASVPPQSIKIYSKAKYVDDSSQLSLETRIANQVRIRIPIASVTSKLATDPEFTIVCPVPGSIAKIRAISPDSWWPKQTRGDIERELPDFKFDLDLNKKPLVISGLRVSGKLRSTKKGVGGVFTIVPTKKRVGRSLAL